MKHFIFYTTDGYTQAPDLTEMENCQILAFKDAPDLQSAWDSFTTLHTKLSERGFHDIKCAELATNLK